MLPWIVWTRALAGIAFRVLRLGAPRWLYTPCYLALDWAPVSCLPDFLHTGGALRRHLPRHLLTTPGSGSRRLSHTLAY